MQGLDQLENLFKSMSSALPEPLKNMQEDMERNMRQGMESTLQKMNLVTREEFDIQTAVLQRTREKLEAMEQRVTAMEQQLGIKLANSDDAATNTTDTPPSDS